MIIYKYQVRAHGESNFEAPIGDVLHVGPDPSGELCVWIAHPTYSTLHNWTVTTVFTGEEYPFGLGEHVGTVRIGNLMLHVFAKHQEA